VLHTDSSPAGRILVGVQFCWVLYIKYEFKNKENYYRTPSVMLTHASFLEEEAFTVDWWVGL